MWLAVLVSGAVQVDDVLVSAPKELTLKPWEVLPKNEWLTRNEGCFSSPLHVVTYLFSVVSIPRPFLHPARSTGVGITALLTAFCSLVYARS